MDAKETGGLCYFISRSVSSSSSSPCDSEIDGNLRKSAQFVIRDCRERVFIVGWLLSVVIVSFFRLRRRKERRKGTSKRFMKIDDIAAS